MRRNNKTCILCKQVYTYCPTCAEFQKYPKWMTMFHDENCKNIFDAVNGYCDGVTSIEVAREKLKKCDLSKKNKMSSVFVSKMDEILKETTKKNVKAIEKVKTEKEVDIESKEILSKVYDEIIEDKKVAEVKETKETAKKSISKKETK